MIPHDPTPGPERDDDDTSRAISLRGANVSKHRETEAEHADRLSTEEATFVHGLMVADTRRRVAKRNRQLAFRDVLLVVLGAVLAGAAPPWWLAWPWTKIIRPLLLLLAG